jgi:radical SAM protein with 4Fe4S-binding SPASM domain
MMVETIPSIGFQELISRIVHGNVRERVPLQGSIELTYRCNLACEHCWVNLPSGDRGARARELSSGELARITDEIVDAGGLWLLLTGGEVFLRPDFFEIYRYMKRKGLMVLIYTNGTTITERVADQLAECPPSRVEISLYGVTPGTYRRMTGHDALNRCLRGIRLLLDRKINLNLKTVTTTSNYDEFLEIRDYAMREFGIFLRYDPNINFRKVEGREGFAPARVRLSAEQVVALDRIIDADEQAFPASYRRDNTLTTDYVFSCGAGINTYHVDPYGRMTSCMMVKSIGYDLRAGSFKEGWASFFERIVERKKSRAGRCDACAISRTCDSCPGWSDLEHGDLETPVDYLCEINHKRAEAFGPESLIRSIAMKGASRG